jgi:hypothetical protein
MKQYFWNLLIWIDQGVNTVTGGDPDETVSSRAGKYAARGRGWFPCQLCKVLNWIQKDHCKNSIEHDRGQQG